MFACMSVSLLQIWSYSGRRPAGPALPRCCSSSQPQWVPQFCLEFRRRWAMLWFERLHWAEWRVGLVLSDKLCWDVKNERLLPSPENQYSDLRYFTAEPSGRRSFYFIIQSISSPFRAPSAPLRLLVEKHRSKSAVHMFYIEVAYKEGVKKDI